MNNGWKAGKDPVQRWLRIITTMVCLAVFAYLAVDPDANIDDLPTIALAIACVLVLLGYAGVVRLPIIGRKDDDDPTD